MFWMLMAIGSVTCAPYLFAQRKHKVATTTYDVNELVRVWMSLFVLSIFTILWALIHHPFWNSLLTQSSFVTQALGIDEIGDASNCALSVVISLGAALGDHSQWTSWHLQKYAMIFIPFNVVNHVIFYDLIGAADFSTTFTVMLFAVVYGLAFARGTVARDDAAAVDVSQPSTGSAPLLEFVSGALMWLLFTSLVFWAGNMNVDYIYAQRSVVNVVLALVGSTAVTFALAERQYESPRDVMRAVLKLSISGGIVIGSVANAVPSPRPAAAIAVGILAGFLTWLSQTNTFVQRLQQHLTIRDDCDIMLTFGVPAVLGGAYSVLIAVAYRAGTPSDLYVIFQPDSVWHMDIVIGQLLALGLTFGIAAVGGTVAALTVRLPPSAAVAESDRAAP
jgi:hypothetical protein